MARRRLVLSDASPLIALSLIDRLNVLHALFGTITITGVVQAEVLAGGNRPGQSALAAALKAKRIRVIFDEWPEPKLPDLDEGEASTLRAAQHYGGPCLVLIDERAGRAVAKASGIAHAGTVGLLVHAKQRGFIQSAKTAFEQLLAKDFRVSAQLIKDALVQAGET